MPSPAIGLAFQQGGTLSLSGSCHRLGSSFVDRHNVIAIHGNAGNAVSCPAIRHILDGLMARLAHGNAIIVVLTNENDGELPDRGHIQRLVEGALIGRSVAEEADANLIGSPVAGGKACAYRDVVTGTHDTVGTQNALVGVGDVHGAALALAVAGFLAKQLRHHELQVAALGYDMTMTAMGAGDIIVIPQAGAHTGGDSFFAKVQMNKSGDLAISKQALCLALKFADADHPQVHVFHGFLGYFH